MQIFLSRKSQQYSVMMIVLGQHCDKENHTGFVLRQEKSGLRLSTLFFIRGQS